MTTEELIKYYQDLLILQYRGKEKARAHIATVVTPIIMDQLPKLIQEAFNVTSAVGPQLDMIGKYVGANRTSRGFNGNVTLNDAEFIQLIQMAIIRNSSGSSLSTIQEFLAQYFPSQITVFDYAFMRMSYFIDNTVTSNLIQVFITEGFLPRPMGVQLSTTVVGPTARLQSFFGFRTYLVAPYHNSPLNTYDDYQLDRPWLSYADGFTGG